MTRIAVRFVGYFIHEQTFSVTTRANADLSGLTVTS